MCVFIAACECILVIGDLYAGAIRDAHVGWRRFWQWSRGLVVARMYRDLGVWVVKVKERGARSVLGWVTADSHNWLVATSEREAVFLRPPWYLHLRDSFNSSLGGASETHWECVSHCLKRRFRKCLECGFVTVVVNF